MPLANALLVRRIRRRRAVRARRADVIIENFVPGVAGKLGLGYEAVRAENPTVV